MTASAAIAEARAVAKTLFTLPGSRGSANEIAAASGLPLALVVRRLKSGCFSPHPGDRVFAVATPPVYEGGRRRCAVWCLTARGERFVVEEQS